MKRIYQDSDIRLVNLPDFKFIKFYTLNKNNYIRKSSSDIIDDQLVLSWDEIGTLEQGVLQFDYSIDSDSDYDYSNLLTDLYIMSEVKKPEEGGGGDTPSVDLGEYYKKYQVDNLLDKKSNIDHKHSEYLTEHQDISELATKTELATKANKEHTHSLYLTEHQSLKDYAKKSEIPSKVSELTNDKNYLTLHQSLVGYAKENWVKNEIANAQLSGNGDVNLEGYATQDWVNQQSFLKEVPSEFITETELNAKKYLTSHQDISGKLDITVASETYQKKGNYLTSVPAEYVTSTELSQEGFLKEHQSLTGYAKESWVTQKIADAQLSGGEVDLTPYATKEDLKSYQPVGNYLTSIPSEYITETELNNKKYLTEHQDISGKLDSSVYTKDKSTFALKTEIPKDYLTAKDIENKADKSEIPSIVGLATKEDLKSKLDTNVYTLDKATFATKDEIPSLDGYLKEVPAEYITETELTDKKYLTAKDVANKADKSELTGLATKSEIADMETKANASATYQKKGNYLTAVPSTYATKDWTNQQGFLKEHQSLSDYALKSEIKTRTSQLTNDSNFISSIPEGYVTDSELNQKGYLTEHQDISGKLDTNTYNTDKKSFALKTDLDNKADKVKVSSVNDGTIQPNTFYEFGVVTNLYLTLAKEITGIYNSYSFEFKSGTTPTTLILPDSIKWKKQPKIVANKTYQVSIVNNLAIIGEF